MGDQTYTLNEAAQLTGLTVDALRQRIKRRKLQAVRGNDGLIRVRLTGLVARPDETSQAAESLHSRLSRHDQTDQSSERTIRAPEGEVTALRDALDRERTRVDGAEARAESEAARAMLAEAREAETRARADQAERERDEARQEREDARVQAASAEGETRALREAREEARRPAWRRLLGR